MYRSSTFADSSLSPVRGEDIGPSDPDFILRNKWLDNSPRMSKLRDHRQRRLMSKLEVNNFLNFIRNEVYKAFSNFQIAI